MRVTYCMPGGVGAVAYNAIVAAYWRAGTVVAFSGGSLLNRRGVLYGVWMMRWLASVGT